MTDMTREQIEEHLETLDRRVEANSHFSKTVTTDIGSGSHGDAAAVYGVSAAIIRQLLQEREWRPIETAPRDRMIVFAAPVFGSEHHPISPKKFIKWDTWTDDPSGDWEDEREIGWRMADAMLWAECPAPL